MKKNLKKCSIRSLVKSDIDDLAKYANNRKIWLNMNDDFPYPYSIIDAIALITYVKSLKHETHFAISLDDECIGTIGFNLGLAERQMSAEIGYWIGEPFWGKGIVSEALGFVTDYAFKNFSIVRIQANVFQNNFASARVLEKNGYVLEAVKKFAVFKDGELFHEMLWAKIKL